MWRFRLQAGRGAIELPPTTAPADGVVHAEPGFRVRAVTLDHHTPVLAYAFEPDREINVRKDSLQGLGLTPGAWLNELKRQYAAGAAQERLRLPDGREAAVTELAEELLTVTPGKRLVYATDLADSAENRETLIALAQNAHTLFLEAVFAEADVAQARLQGHLTARACGEIAAAAGVSRLVPFHLSRRYVDHPQQLFEEIEAVCGCAVQPVWQAENPAT